jgi:hypothetical protein
MRNPFVHFIELLGIKHTKKYAGKAYNEHPFKNSLYAFSSLLHDYGADNVTVQLLEEDKDITKLEAPLVVSLGSHIAIVSKIENDYVTYTTLNNTKAKDTVKNFNGYWSGIALLAETSSSSIEPDYVKHKLSDLFNAAQKCFLLVCAIAVFFYTIWTKELYLNAGIMSLLAVSLAGVLVSYLLIFKNYKIKSNYTEKICSLIKEGNCNEILESDAARLFGLIGWSEIGLSYFVSNCIILLFFSELLPLAAVVNVCALPYTFWSVWYQKFKANSWCTMCLIVRGLLWLTFAGNLIFGNFNHIPEAVVLLNLVILSGVYGIPFVVVNLLLPMIIKTERTESITQEFNSLKANDDVIRALLAKEQRFEVDKNSSQILFGNKNAAMLVTILTNPHCSPCARVHDRLAEILQDETGKFCIQYIFSSFREEYDDSSRFLIATYLNNPLHETCRIYHDWFKRGGRANRFRFFQTHKFAIDERCMNEFNRHNEWMANAKLKATPTVLINGRKLPAHYNIENIHFFTTLDFSGI